MDTEAPENTENEAPESEVEELVCVVPVSM
jgi:hypothetical protein